MNIIGISCFYHDSAACLIRDGDIVAAAQEERFTRKKHDHDFPQNALSWCLKEGAISVAEVDYFVFYEKPFVKFERILETALAYAPSGISEFIAAMPLWLKFKLWIPTIIRHKTGFEGPILFSGHHEAHAASAFYPSPYHEAAFLTMDGVGEWETASFGVGKGNTIKIDSYLRFPHSLGLLYSTFTYYCGFKVNSGEYKLMGLAPYGQPNYKNLILDNLIAIKEDGAFKLNMNYFGYCNSLRMTNSRFDKLFGGPRREPESKITQKYMDIAASIQSVTEDVMLGMAKHVHAVTGQDKLCLAGGVALNCVGNGKILREGPFKKIWIQPASGDAGCAVGAALLIWYQYLGNKRISDEKTDSQKASFCGPGFDDASIENFLTKNNIPHKKLTYEQIPALTADLIAHGNVIGWFQGKMEFGPRALGNRSIIADARSTEMQKKMNLKIKFRESFRPFAPTVLREKMHEWFEMNADSPYMLLVTGVRKDKRTKESMDKLVGFDKLNVKRSEIPAVTHVDYSARIQTVKPEENKLYYDLIQAFYKKTNCPVIINTSFNVRGEPLVCSPLDAFRCFMRTGMDHLVIGCFLLDKKEQKPLEKDSDWRKDFALD
ncbi:MAG TPA: carbamoyltransferase [Candidatus Omnitrophota bacterium]|nr:carbamoyltransferase [Candidatus Omnitrophota bacterium]